MEVSVVAGVIAASAGSAPRNEVANSTLPAPALTRLTRESFNLRRASGLSEPTVHPHRDRLLVLYDNELTVKCSGLDVNSIASLPGVDAISPNSARRVQEPGPRSTAEG